MCYILILSQTCILLLCSLNTVRDPTNDSHAKTPPGMFLVQGTIATFLGLLTYVWMVDFPDQSQHTPRFLTPSESALAVSRIDADRGDSGAPEPFELKTSVLVHFLDPKLYAFCVLFFLLNIVSTALAYFLPIILQSGMGFSADQAILLAAPPYYYAVIPVLLVSNILP